MPTIAVEVTRGPLIENLHRADAAVVDSTGRILFHLGDPRKVTFWRSAAKPIQAMPLVFTGAADALGFGSEHLAIIAASHFGEPVHTAAVQAALGLAGLEAGQLQCGTHPPFDRESAEALTRAGEHPQPVHNNCSGKHLGMMALAKHMGFPTENYLDPASQVQRVILANVAEVAGLPAGDIAIGVDGCGVPVYGMPLRNMGLAFARLADPTAMPPGKEAAGRRFQDAMLKHPYLVAGRRGLCSLITGLPGERFVAKSGADGVYCMGILPDAVAGSRFLAEASARGGVGIAIKAEDGDLFICRMVAVEILRQLGVVTEADLAVLNRYRAAPIKNHAHRTVGERRPNFQVQFGGGPATP